jgi:hypothetical protein
VPLIPTHRNSVEFRSPQDTQFFADVGAVDLDGFDADTEGTGYLPGWIPAA